LSFDRLSSQSLAFHLFDQTADLPFDGQEEGKNAAGGKSPGRCPVSGRAFVGIRLDLLLVLAGTKI